MPRKCGNMTKQLKAALICASLDFAKDFVTDMAKCSSKDSRSVLAGAARDELDKIIERIEALV